MFTPQLLHAQGVVVAPKTVLGTVNGTTRPIATPTITVCAAGNANVPCAPALAGALFKDAALTQPLSDPFTGDANGNYQFAVAAGTYTVTETAAGFSGYSYQLTVQPASSGTIANATNLVGPGTVTGTYTHSSPETFTSSVRTAQAIADQGTACTNGELVLSAGWQSTGSATVTAVAGNGQTCSWTITTGTTTAANPTVTDTLTNVLPNATTACEMNIHGGTHTAAAGEGFQQTTLSASTPVFMFNGTPTAGGTTYLVTRRCGP